MTNSSGIDERKNVAAVEARRFVTFAVTGGIAAVCNLVARFLMSRVMRYELAVLFSYLVGMVVAFVLARSFVFEKSSTEWHAQLGRFAIVNVFAFAQVWLVSVGLVRLIFPWLAFHWHPEDVGHVIGVASPVLVSYYAHKHFSFRQATGNKTLRQSDGEIVQEL